MRKTIIGKTGTGKTLLVKQLIRESTARQIFIFDFIGEYWSIKDERIVIRRIDLYEFCQLAWNSAAKGSKTLIAFDEIDSLKDYYGEGNVKRWVGFLYRYGRHKDLELIAVSRSFYDTPIFARRLTKQFLLFQITEQRDHNYIKPFLGYNMDDKYIETIIKLETFQYIIISL